MFVIIIPILLLAGGWLLYRTSFRIGSGTWVRALCRGRGGSGRVALTFDDGTHPAFTPQVLDVLKRHGVGACFFVVGERIDPAILQRIDREGHLIGNHTFSHRGMGPFAPTERMICDAARCDARIESATGHRPRLFRPPFGVTNPMIGRMVAARGYTVVGWSVRPLDTLGQAHGKVLARIRRQLHDGAVILLHDNREGAAELLEALIALLEEARYRIVRVDELLDIKAYKDKDED